jgi:hypothetical protein
VRKFLLCGEEGGAGDALLHFGAARLSRSGQKAQKKARNSAPF